MAPVTATAVGITRQTIDDPELVSLLSRLSDFRIRDEAIEGGRVRAPVNNDKGTNQECLVDVYGLVAELEKYPTWRFQEQADLCDWIKPLNVIDASLTQILRSHPNLLLIGNESGVCSTKNNRQNRQNLPSYGALSLEDVLAVPPRVVVSVKSMIRFLSQLLRNATNKSVFNSVESLLLLLSAADDELASLALEALAHLAAPPALHRQQAPEVGQHATALHSAAPAAHEQLLVLARGWGSRGSGLGLYVCATWDDSQQPWLPAHAGEVHFDFLAPKTYGGGTETNDVSLVSIHVKGDDMVKREEDSAIPHVYASSAELFFTCLEKGGGRDRVPADKRFALLASVRLARSFHTNEGRVGAVERRLRALICALHVHPSQEVMAGYFQAQPELCGEIAELLKTSTALARSYSSSLAPVASSGSGCRTDGELAGSRAAATVPHGVRVLAVEALTALVARRDGSNGAISPVARHANVLGELGVGKGQYLGLLPTLLRYTLASLNSGGSSTNGGLAQRQGQGTEDRASGAMMEPEDLDLDIGMAFLEATQPVSTPGTLREEQSLEFIDAVLTLTSAVVSLPSGTAALTDCGLIPALVSTVSLDCSGDDTGTGETKREKENACAAELESHADCLRKFIAAQAVQILEGAIVTHSSALSAFHELNGVDLLVRRLHYEIEEVKREGEKLITSTVSAAGTLAGTGTRTGSGYETVTEMGTGTRTGTGTNVDSTDMSTGSAEDDAACNLRPLRASRRVLMFSIVNGLTVVFHQQESSSSRSGGAQLRKPELTGALMDIMDNIDSYGGVLASLSCTLLSDVMNADPQVVHHVHSSGLAKSFLDMIMGKRVDNSKDFDVIEPTLPPSAELIMALPNVLSALSLTEDGAAAVREADPFPSLLSIFCSPRYAMPRSRCLLNDMTAIVGTGLDELMRHVPSLRPLGIRGLVGLVRRVVVLGGELYSKELIQGNNECVDGTGKISSVLNMGADGAEGGTPLENARTCFLQYAFNASQLLEQVLQNADHATPFVEVGGFDVLLELYPLLLPSGVRLLAHSSCLSSPSSADLTHCATTGALTLTIKSVASHYESHKLIRKVVSALDAHLDKLVQSQKKLRRLGPGRQKSEGDSDSDLDAVGILDGVPRAAIHVLLKEHAKYKALMDALSSYLRDILNSEWLVALLAAVVRTAFQRGQDMNNIWVGSGDRDQGWKSEVSSPAFATLVRRITALNVSAQIEVCRVRSEDGFDKREEERRGSPGNGNLWQPASYRLRIVHQDSALVRDGTEIDSSASVGSLEMGEVVEAFDRCILSCGVMRYRTRRGWISEHTRGGTRELLVEVMNVEGVSPGMFDDSRGDSSMKNGRIDCGVPDLGGVAASMLSRLQRCVKNLLACLSRSVAQGLRSLPLPQRFASQIGSYAGKVIRLVVQNLQLSFQVGQNQASLSPSVGYGHDYSCGVSKHSRDDNFSPKSDDVLDAKVCSEDALNFAPRYDLSSAGLCMYFGAVLELLEACLYGYKPYEEKRERRTLNVPLLVSILCADGFFEGFDYAGTSMEDEKMEEGTDSAVVMRTTGFFGAVRFVLDHSLDDMAEKVAVMYNGSDQRVKVENVASSRARRRLSRAVCASLPQTLSLLKWLTSRSRFMGSHMCSVLGRMKRADLEDLIGEVPKLGQMADGFSTRSEDSESSIFHPNQFCRGFHCEIAKIATELWTDPRLDRVPAHLLHPVVLLVGEVVASLEEASKVVQVDDSNSSSSIGAAGRSGSSNSGGANGSATAARSMPWDLQRRLSRGMQLPAAMNFFISGVGPPGLSTRAASAASAPFEPSEDSINRLVEMGFSRDHALEALETTESNRIEVAMEYALSHPPPSPGTAERRRVARDERRRTREARATLATASREGASSSENPDSTAIRADSSAGRDGAVNATVASLEGSDRGAELVSTSDGTDPSPGDGAGPGDMEVEEESGSSAGADGSKTEDAKPEVPSSGTKSQMSEADKEAARLREVESRSAGRAVMCLKILRQELVKVSLNIIAGGSCGGSFGRGGLCSSDAVGKDDGRGKGDGEAEAVTSVMCHFLLELCGRYASDRTVVVESLVSRLKSDVRAPEGGVGFSVRSGYDEEFASLCHATVIILRALPRTKALLLRSGLVGMLLQCIRVEIGSSRHKGKRKGDIDRNPSQGWPRWFSPALLVLDIMAQPTAAPVVCEEEVAKETDDDGGGCGPKGEFTRMCLERKKQEAFLSKTARDIFAAVNGKPIAHSGRKNGKAVEKRSTDEIKSDEKPASSSLSQVSGASSQPDSVTVNSFPAIPCYLPLMPPEEAEICMTTCLRILRHRPKKDDKEILPPPSVVQSTLLLLARVLRSHKIASHCLKMGVAELILALPSQCRFAGNTGLVAVILRHLLEDDATLRTAMETEIRVTVARLHRQQNRGSSSSSSADVPRVSARAFVQAVTPLICRDPVTFLKAAAASVMVECSPSEGSVTRGGRNSRSGNHIVLLSATERAKNLKALHEAFATSAHSALGTPGNKSGSNAKRGRSVHPKTETRVARSKSPHHYQAASSGSPKRSKKDRTERGNGVGGSSSFIVLNGSPANHVTCLLIAEMIRVVERERKHGLRKSEKVCVKVDHISSVFLKVVDCLDILSDLVLAVPACAAAIHRYRPSTSNGIARKAMTDLKHGLYGCPMPPSTFVSYLLHTVLPQPRSMKPIFILNDAREKVPGEVEAERKHSYMRVRVAQASARLLVALCARAGEGRRRVVADLAFALSGGRLKASLPVPVTVRSESEAEMWALQAWGEVCWGLAAPKSTNNESNSALSWEVVKLMLEYGVGHALMAGIQRVDLYHPLASGAAGALLKTMEMFTRGSVVDVVSEMVKADTVEKGNTTGQEGKTEGGKRSTAGKSRQVTFGPSQRSEAAFADDAMLEEGFDPDSAYRVHDNSRRSGLRSMVDDIVHLDEDDGESVEGENSDETSDEENVEEFSGSSSDVSDSSEESDQVHDYSSVEDIMARRFDANSSDESSDSSSDGSGHSENDGEAMDVAEEDGVDEDEEEGEQEEGDDDDDDEDEDEEDGDEDGVEDEDFGWEQEDQDFFDNSGGDESEDVPPLEAELEEGWTRIESSGIGGMFLRQNAPSGESNSSRHRAAMVVDATEAVIGNILRGSDIQMEALAEIEDTLGITISHRSDLEAGRGGRDGGFGIIGSSTTSSGSGDGDLAGTSTSVEVASSRNRGAIGAFPGVQQQRLEDSGQLSSGQSGNWAGRWSSEMTGMDYAFGDASIAVEHCEEEQHSGARNDRNEEGGDDFVVPSTVDTQLFPGGPAAATHARTQHYLHPLFCDVELPAVNIMNPRLRPHGSQLSLASRGAGAGIESTSGTGSYLSGTRMIRLNRGPEGVPILEQTFRNATLPNHGFESRWTDDGQPLDGTTADFSISFEQALGETIARNIEAEATDRRSDVSASGAEDEVAVDNAAAESAGVRDGTAGGEEAATERNEVNGDDVGVAGPSGSEDAVEDTDPRADADSSLSANNSTAETDRSLAENDASSNVAINASNEVAVSAPAAVSASTPTRPLQDRASTDDGATNETPTNEGNSSEGEGVANSLASGLNLSPRSQSSSSSSTDGGVSDAPHAQESRCGANESTDTQSPAQNETESMEVEGEPIQGQGDEEHENQVPVEESSAPESGGEPGDNVEAADGQHHANEHGFVCPPGMDLEVFNSLPPYMQQEVVDQHSATMGMADQLDSSSGLDPEALAALPEEMRREVIAQEQQERMQRQQPPADPSNAEEMDNASFIASLAPDLREEILLTAEENFLGSLPADIQAEAQLLRERASTQHRRSRDETFAQSGAASGSGIVSHGSRPLGGGSSTNATSSGSRRRGERSRTGKVKVECDRSQILFMPSGMEEDWGPLVTASSMKSLVRLMYLLSPVRPQRILQKLFLNLSANLELRRAVLGTFVALVIGDSGSATFCVNSLQAPSVDSSTPLLCGNNDVKMVESSEPSGVRSTKRYMNEDFPPSMLIGTAPDVLDTDFFNPNNMDLFRRRQGGNTAAASIAANLPASARGSSDDSLPPVVARRIIETLLYMSKNSARVSLDMLSVDGDQMDESSDSMDAESCLDRLLDLICIPLYAKSSTNLEQLLTLIESVVALLSSLPKEGDPDHALRDEDIEAAASSGKEWADAPRPVVAQNRLRSLCSILRLESCKDSCFQKVNTIARRLCRVEANRTKILYELATVAQGLGADAIRDMRALSVHLNIAVRTQREKEAADGVMKQDKMERPAKVGNIPASAVTLSTSSSELKLLRVLQTLHALCGDASEESSKKNDGQTTVTAELVDLLHSVELESLWDELSACLKVVSVLEGVANEDSDEKKIEGEGSAGGEEEDVDAESGGGKKLQSSVAALLTRFLPTIEAFFVVNASSKGGKEGDGTEEKHEETNSVQDAAVDGTKQPSHDRVVAGGKEGVDGGLEKLVGGKRLVTFVASNKVLLNALLRSNPSLLDKGLRAMVHVPQCRPFMDFDVKRQWFKTQVRRLRQHASRRHGSLRLSINRRQVFEDAFRQLRLRNAEEMRGRLHITFTNEEGVDAGGLSREFFAILAKEMFNPNYALFTSTEDGCTFQPNPNSSINPDHLSYFHFVGRIVGKAVVDGFLLDAHFTRSLYKHMLGIKPTHEDMQAIDPDYYKNLQMILEYNLDDIGLELTFSTEDHSFGRSQIIDLVPDGRHKAVTEENKSQYVSLVCQNRMTTAIERQIKAYLDGFYELVKPELISIFTAKELELLISGMPDIDMHELQANTEYQNYKPSDPQIIWFWNTMFSLTKSEKAAFLQFVTGSSKVPLEGFSQLQGMRGTQKFSIHRVGGSSQALVSAHTCFNALDLPVYKSEEELRQKILYAISEGSGGFLFA